MRGWSCHIFSPVTQLNNDSASAIVGHESLADFHVFVMQYCHAFGSSPFQEGTGRGGIRTHGGFPHARFRVECLKPDSATLPIGRHCRCYFTMRNCQAKSEFAKPRHHASVKWRWRSHSPTAELRRGSFMNSDARLATSRPTSCSETNRDVRSFGAFTKATLR